MDIFISYRRKGGDAWAGLLNAKLKALGVKPFYDKNSIENEDFTNKIKKSIVKCPNFMLVLSPGIFSDYNERQVDWVFEEVKCAISLKKNIILLQVDHFNPDTEIPQGNETFDFLRRLNMTQYINDSVAQEQASLTNITSRMIDAHGKPYIVGEKIEDNSWYAKYEMTDEDSLWIKADYDVCHKADQAMLARICNESVLKGKEHISLCTLKMYDIDTYYKKYNFTNPRTGAKYIDEIYGTTYESDVDKANDLFGANHFVADKDSNKIIDELRSVLIANSLPGFDIIEMVLIIKDLKRPDKVVREATKLLNPAGGVIFIRELDDDFVIGFPHEDVVKKLLELLQLDIGSGNRHTGKKVYTFLSLAGADKIYISDEIISTANHKSRYQERICDNYFSYLKPELRNLAKEDPDTYGEGYRWIEKNYDRVEALFCSSEFYFRPGYIWGYGTFESDENM